MSLLLNIDTATEHASICLSEGEKIIGLIESTEQKNHASFVQPAIQQLIEQAGITLKDINAIAVTSGPGSYTGLRVGLASAKGICYALQKPLILVNTLEVMAQSVLTHYQSNKEILKDLTSICPLIDARRMEVFTAVYDISLQEIKAPHALLLDPLSFSSLLSNGVIFTGSGRQKLEALIPGTNAIFSDIQHNATHLASRALISYKSGRFADLAYSEPLYVKEFFDTSRKP